MVKLNSDWPISVHQMLLDVSGPWMHRQMSEIDQKMLIWKCQLKPCIFRIYLVYSVGSIRFPYAKKTPLFGHIRLYSVPYVFGRRIWLPNIRSWRTLVVRLHLASTWRSQESDAWKLNKIVSPNPFCSVPYGDRYGDVHKRISNKIPSDSLDLFRLLTYSCLLIGISSTTHYVSFSPLRSHFVAITHSALDYSQTWLDHAVTTVMSLVCMNILNCQWYHTDTRTRSLRKCIQNHEGIAWKVNLGRFQRTTRLIRYKK